jgi:hypothetical protein
MKWFSVFSILALALLTNACEKHPAAELPPEHATAFGKHAATHDAEEKHEANPAGAHAAEPAVGEAPKFFPDKK